MATCSISDLLNDWEELDLTKNTTLNLKGCQMALEFAVMNLNCALRFRVISSALDHVDRRAAILDEIIKIALKLSTIIIVYSTRGAIISKPFSYTTCHFIRSTIG
jgi:hypothetical protein